MVVQSFCVQKRTSVGRLMNASVFSHERWKSRRYSLIYSPGPSSFMLRFRFFATPTFLFFFFPSRFRSRLSYRIVSRSRRPFSTRVHHLVEFLLFNWDFALARVPETPAAAYRTTAGPFVISSPSFQRLRRIAESSGESSLKTVTGWSRRAVVASLEWKASSRVFPCVRYPRQTDFRFWGFHRGYSQCEWMRIFTPLWLRMETRDIVLRDNLLIDISQFFEPNFSLVHQLSAGWIHLFEQWNSTISINLVDETCNFVISFERLNSTRQQFKIATISIASILIVTRG